MERGKYLQIQKDAEEFKKGKRGIYFAFELNGVSNEQIDMLKNLGVNIGKVGSGIEGGRLCQVIFESDLADDALDFGKKSVLILGEDLLDRIDIDHPSLQLAHI